MGGGGQTGRIVIVSETEQKMSAEPGSSLSSGTETSVHTSEQ